MTYWSSGLLSLRIYSHQVPYFEAILHRHSVMNALYAIGHWLQKQFSLSLNPNWNEWILLIQGPRFLISLDAFESFVTCVLSSFASSAELLAETIVGLSKTSDWQDLQWDAVRKGKQPAVSCGPSCRGGGEDREDRVDGCEVIAAFLMKSHFSSCGQMRMYCRWAFRREMCSCIWLF